MEQQQTLQQQQQRVIDEFSPKKLILQIQELFKYVLRKWYIILVAGILCSTTAWFYYKKKKTEFIAEITFAIDEEITKQKKSGLSEITEQLGLGPSDAGLLYNSESNFAILMMSRLMMENTLRKQVPETKPHYTYADFFLDSLNLRNKWMKGSKYITTKFDSTAKSKEEQLFQNGIITKIQEFITSKCIKIDKKLSGSNILSVSCISEHELFSKMLLEELVNNVTEHYVNAQTLRAKVNMIAINKRIDSVKRAYIGTLYAKASIADANINVVRQRATVPGISKQTDADILRSAYIDLALNLESAKTSLLKNTPVVQVLDAPVLPLKTNTVNTLRKSALFFIIGVFITALFIGLHAVYRFIMTV